MGINKIKIMNLLGLVLVLLFVYFSHNYLFVGNSDLAHHYALVDNLSKYLSVNNNFGNLGEMAHYPNFSHWLAVIFGKILGSNIAGISFVVITSLVVIWMILSFFILKLRPIVSLITFSLLLLFGLVTHFFGAFFGEEIVGNFFYSQLVAESIAFTVLLFAYFIFDRKRLLILFVLFSSLLLAFFHLLPAIQILGFSFLAVFYEIYKTKRIDYTNIILLFFGLILFILHPSFNAMLSIGENNGHLSFSFMPHPTEINLKIIILLFLISCFISLYFILSKKFTNHLALVILSIFSLSNSLLIVLQIFAFTLGHGSEYAIKKYIFTLVTLTTIQIIILLAMKISCIIEKRYKLELYLPKFFMASIFSIMIIGIQLGVKPIYLLSDLKKIENILNKYQHQNIENAKNHKAIYMDNDNVLRYMFSISILEHPRDEFGTKLFTLKNIDQDIYHYDFSYIIIKNNYIDFDIPENLKTSLHEGFHIFSKENFLKLLSLKYSSLYDENGLFIVKKPEVIKQGWNSIESWGVWSAANKASIFIKNPTNKTFSQFSFTANSWNEDKNISISINGINCGTVLVLSNKFNEYTMQCPINFKNKLEIDFYITNWNVSPKKLKISEDVRNLGIGLQSIKIH